MKIPPPTFRLVARLDACINHPELDLTGDETSASWRGRHLLCEVLPVMIRFLGSLAAGHAKQF